MGVGGLITGIMGATGNGPSVDVPNARQVGRNYVNSLNQFVRGVPIALQLEPQYKPAYAQLESGLFQNVLPQTISALRTASPGASNLWDELAQSANEQLGAGANLDPSLQRVTTQAIRGSQAARGLGMGPADALQESTALTQLGNTLRQQRQGFATNVAQGISGAETQPAMNATAGILSASSPSLVPGSAMYDMFNTAYNARAAANINNANLQAGMESGFNSVD